MTNTMRPKLSIIAGRAYYARTKMPTHCTLCSRRLSSRNRASSVVGTLTGTFDDLCVSCYNIFTDPEEQHVTDESSPSARTNRSHADCPHPRTPAARARCRKEN